jgi:carbon-monoxide dehydrogenase small subunit
MDESHSPVWSNDQAQEEIFTIEGLSGGQLDPLQEAFVKYGAIQCGFCTPGMIVTSKVLLNRNPHPTEEEIKRALSGNLCRCTGYVKIIEAVRNASTAEGRK